MAIAVKGQHEGSLWGWICSVSLPYQCQCPGCNIVLQVCKILKLGNWVKDTWNLLFLKLHVHLQLSQNKKFNKGSKYCLFITVLFIMAKKLKQSKCPKMRDVKVN